MWKVERSHGTSDWKGGRVPEFEAGRLKILEGFKRGEARKWICRTVSWSVGRGQCGSKIVNLW